ncbi:MAG: FixJ family two-component response regulator [Candidatus Azotimanducaceae bacterium]|jgi:FixJ family two-component response regulator
MYKNKISRPEGLNATVYIAGQDCEVSQSIQFLLKTESIFAHIFDTGRSLLNQVLVEPPTCIVIDATMSDIDGTTLLEYLNEHSLPIPVILLGENSNIPVVVEVIKAGAWDYFEKPFIQYGLIASVKRALKMQEK